MLAVFTIWSLFYISFIHESTFLSITKDSQSRKENILVKFAF